ncbi:MAG: hypothetical protein ACFFAO_02215 [Candidatus Hermodarchaeota archaeon]
MSEKKDVKKGFQKADIKIAKVGEDIITFKETNINKIKVLSCKDDTATISGKVKDIYKMRVIDLMDDKEKNFNPASSRLRAELSKINESEGLIGQSLKIEKIGSGTGTFYKVDKINT